MHWYYVDGKRKVGPVTETDIERLVNQGKITSDTIVWNEITSKWQPYGEAKAGTSGGTSFATGAADIKKDSICAECGRTFPGDEMLHYGESVICATCKPIFFQKLKEGVSLPGAMTYAGFWIRFGAKFIDGIITGLAGMMLVFAGGGIMMMSSKQGDLNPLQIIVALSQYVIPIAYTTFFLGKFGATPGKMACGIKVVTADGGSVSYLRAFGRYFAEILSAIILSIGYIMAAFDNEKRALHDRICNTRVIRRR